MSRQKGKETKPAGEESNRTRRSKIILETSIDGFCVVGPDGKILEVNSSLCNITGYSKEELLKMKITDIEARATAEQTAQQLDKVMKQGYDRFETKHRRKGYAHSSLVCKPLKQLFNRTLLWLMPARFLKPILH